MVGRGANSRRQGVRNPGILVVVLVAALAGAGCSDGGGEEDPDTTITEDPTDDGPGVGVDGSKLPATGNASQNGTAVPLSVDGDVAYSILMQDSDLVQAVSLQASSLFNLAGVAFQNPGGVEVDHNKYGVALWDAGTRIEFPAACGSSSDKIWDNSATTGSAYWSENPPGRYTLWAWGPKGTEVRVKFNSGDTDEPTGNVTPALTGWRHIHYDVETAMTSQAPYEESFSLDLDPGPGLFLGLYRTPNNGAPESEASTTVAEGDTCVTKTSTGGPFQSAPDIVIQAVVTGQATWTGTFTAPTTGLSNTSDAQGLLLIAPSE